MDLTLGERQGGPRLRDALPRLVDRVGAVTELRLRLRVDLLEAALHEVPRGGVQHRVGVTRFEDLFLNEELFAQMREQVDGPWMVYYEQCRGLRANDTVMGFLTQLEDLGTNA